MRKAGEDEVSAQVQGPGEVGEKATSMIINNCAVRIVFSQH